jgi:hypothetical protein
MRRRAPATAGGYRAELAASLRGRAGLARRVLREAEGGPELLEAAELAAERGESVEGLARGYVSRWALLQLEGLRRAALLEAGEPVPVAAWELPPEHPARRGSAWHTLEPDGSLTARPSAPA